MVVFPDIEEGFLPEKMSIDELNASPHTTKNLFFVQKMSKSEYVFRHHTDNNVDMDAELKNFKLKKLNKAEHFIGLVKVHINHIGKIDKKY